MVEPPRQPDPFPGQFAGLFHAHFPRIFRVLDRLSGDAELAADLAQEAFIRLHRRGSLPELPEAWLISVGLNLLRNERSTERRRRRLLSLSGEPPGAAPSPDEALLAGESAVRVRAAVDGLPERSRELLLLWAEGYNYREIALALALHEASVGTLLARARRDFRDALGGGRDAP